MRGLTSTKTPKHPRQQSFTDSISDSPPSDLSLPVDKSVEATPKPPSANSSWFSSFGRAKGREKGKAVSSLSSEASPSQSEADAITQSERETRYQFSESTAVEEGVVEPQADLAGQSFTPTRPIKTASSPDSRRTWYPSSHRPATSPKSSSPLQTTSFPESDDSQHFQRPPLSGSASSFPSSIDEDRVPSLAQTPTSASDDEQPPKVLSVHSPGDGPWEGDATIRARINSLNPSSSRFTISLPLLGRQKVKLEDVVNKVNSQDRAEKDIGDAHIVKNNESSLPTDETKSNDATGSEFVSRSTAQWEGITSTATATNDSCGNATITTDTASDLPTTETTNEHSDGGQAPTMESSSAASIVSEQNRYSWWDYIGWGTTVPNTAAAEPKSESVQEESDSRVGIETSVTGPPAGDDKHNATDSIPDSVQANVDDVHPTTGTTTTATTTTATTTSTAWFGPWSSTAESADGKKSRDTSQSVPPPLIASDPSSESQSSVATVKPSSSEVTTVKATPMTQATEASTIPDSKAPSIRSSDTAARGSWFAPWTWYAPEPASVKDEQDQREESDPNTMTASEKIKEEALARQRSLEAEQEQDTQPQPQHEQSEEVLSTPISNPLDQTITTRYSSGWASFFGTVSKRTKLITEHGEAVKRDENGMEVMDLDENEELPAEQEEQGSNEKPKNKDLERVKKAEGANSSGSGSRPASTRSAPPAAATSEIPEPERKKAKKEKSREGKEGKKGAPPTIIVSDAIRQEGESLLGKERDKSKKSPTSSVKSAPPNTSTPSSSPSPTERKDKGKKSSSQPPAAANSSLPNLVLPTWADTFHTPPRSIVPASARSRLGLNNKNDVNPSMMGKLGRVSKWLLGSDQVPGHGVKRPTTDTRVSSRSDSGSKPVPMSPWEEWGKALPRALDVLQGREPPFEDPPLLQRLMKKSTDGGVAPEGNIAEQMSHGIAGKGSAGTGQGDGAEGHVRDVLRGCKRVVVIGIHGWFPGAVMRTMLGEPTGTSPKFVNMMVQALEEFQEAHGVKLEKITKIPLEGEGTIDRRVEKLYNSLLSNDEWMSDLHDADAIFVSTHSQGSVVSTHLLDRLIRDRHIRTSKNAAATEGLADLGVNMIPLKPQRPYIQYFESAAARELFEFQNTENEVSKSYVKALRNVVNNGTKMVYVASLDDQVVPIYSGLFTSASHPLILRALYIDGDAYSSSDFLSNLLVLLLRIQNCGLSDSGLLAHLSEVTAGSLNGIGHSTAYEELSTYALAVNYLFLTDEGLEEHPDLQVESFNATAEQNDYEIPWALRDLIADERVAHFFSHEITQLRDAFREWNPKTAILRDIKRKLQPIQRLPSNFASGVSSSISKL
ncbi:hypothetical protein VNI00_011803 [Paramarasmius palmivorus]|uniref:YMC020W-like alpha/beta hydrolase domain-containing protein n=1 Tax=Paramarasmius palmivorus TaxID=297713 RepID=A0AAW0C7M2_9AGAR